MERLLWFRPEEFKEVNTTWQNGGIDAVISKWSDSRTYDSGKPGTVSVSAVSRTPGAPPNSYTLLVSEFAPDSSPDPAQLNYYRSRHFPLPEALQSEVLETLKTSGLLDKLLPAFDEETEKSLSPLDITGVGCFSEWFGPDNMYGEGSVLAISITLNPDGNEPVLVRLTIDQDANVLRILWCEKFAETGYEGHNRLAVTLTQDELRALLPLIHKVADLPVEAPQPAHFGLWLGNSMMPSEHS